MAAAALCCPAFVSCEGLDDNDKTDGTEQNDGQEPGTGEASYIDDVTATASSITFTVNSTSEYGYKYAVISESVYDMAFEMSKEEDLTEEENVQKTLAVYLMFADDQTEAGAITVTSETAVYGEGTPIASETKYYIAAVERNGSDADFANADIKYVTVTTPAAE